MIRRRRRNASLRNALLAAGKRQKPHCGGGAREYVKEHGLTLCADGFRRLIIKKENDMATPYKECPHCGAHLDSGEKCDCRAAEADGNAEKELKERTKDNDN